MSDVRYVWLVMAIDYEHQAVLSIHASRAGADAAPERAIGLNEVRIIIRDRVAGLDAAEGGAGT